MSRTSFRVTVLALVSSTLFATALATALPAEPAERSGVTTLLQTARASAEPAGPAQAPSGAEPVTPFPMNLPDEATDRELKGERGIGIVWLVAAGMISAAIVGGLFYLVTFRSWRPSH